jgi:hypothetical protein
VHFMSWRLHELPTTPKLTLRLARTWNALADSLLLPPSSFFFFLYLVSVVGIVERLADHQLRLMSIAAGPFFKHLNFMNSCLRLQVRDLDL